MQLVARGANRREDVTVYQGSRRSLARKLGLLTVIHCATTHELCVHIVHDALYISHLSPPVQDYSHHHLEPSSLPPSQWPSTCESSPASLPS